MIGSGRGRSCLGLFRHLEFEKFPWSRGQIRCAISRDDHVVFDANAAEPFQINARLNRKNHSLLDDRCFATPEPGDFVDFNP